MNSNNSYRGKSPFRGRGGRFRSKRRGRNNGRGRGNGKTYKSNKYGSTPATKEYKFAPQVQGKPTNYATYSATKDVIINYIQKNYKEGLNVVKSIRDGAIVNLRAD